MNQTWKQSGQYTKYEIAGIPYLLPFGQNIADHRRGLRINASGAYIWNLLETETTFAHILKCCAAHWQTGSENLPALEQDLKQFLSALYARGLVETGPFPVSPDIPSSGLSGSHPSSITPSAAAPETIDMLHADHSDTISPDAAAWVRGIPKVRIWKGGNLCLKIGGLTLLLCGPRELFSKAFDPFLYPAPLCPAYAMPHQTILLSQDRPPACKNGVILLQTGELTIYKRTDMVSGGAYLLRFPSMTQLTALYLTADGRHALFFCTSPCTRAETKTLQEELFHAIRLSYLYVAQKYNLYALHSASLLYRGQAWLFSGRSGTGKSTHTSLWNRLFQTPLLNGDLNLLGVCNGQPLVYGLPWCGTSGISTAVTHPLGGIILLRQDMHNTVESLTPDRQCLLTAQRLISPAWTETQLHACLQFTETLTPRILVCLLHCTTKPEAATVMRRTVDAYLDKSLFHTESGCPHHFSDA